MTRGTVFSIVPGGEDPPRRGEAGPHGAGCPQAFGPPRVLPAEVLGSVGPHSIQKTKLIVTEAQQA